MVIVSNTPVKAPENVRPFAAQAPASRPMNSAGTTERKINARAIAMIGGRRETQPGMTGTS